MPILNKKLDRFTTALLADATAETERTVAELKRKRAEALTEAERQVLNETYNYIHGEVGRIKADSGRRVSKRMLDAKREVYLRRSEIATEVFDAVRERIATYTATPAYGQRLCQLLEDGVATLKGGEDIQIYLRPEDMGLSDTLRNHMPSVTFSFEEGDFVLGGLVAQSLQLGLRCDSTFDSAEEALEGHFAELFGLSLSDMSDEQ